MALHTNIVTCIYETGNSEDDSEIAHRLDSGWKILHIALGAPHTVIMWRRLECPNS